MKRLIVTCTFLTLLVASCDSPVTNSNTGQSSVRSQANQPHVTIPSIPYSNEPVQPDTVRKAIWLQFKSQNGNKWRVRWNEHTGLPASVFLGRTKKNYRGPAEEAARAFLEDYQALFGFSNIKQLKYVKTQTYRGIRYVTFNQTVHGVPVYEAEYKVHLRSNGKVDMVNGHYYPNLDISTTPSVSKARAVSIAKSDLKRTSNSTIDANSKLIIYRIGKEFRLAQKVHLFSKQSAVNWYYFVDAQSGEVLDKYNNLMDVTGDGDAYSSYPGLSLVTNRPLYRLNGNSRLQGTYAYVVNDDGAEAYSGNNSFQYSPGNTHFDEVNLYYHVDWFRHDFIGNVESAGQYLGFTQITAHAHTPRQDLNGDGTIDPPNSWFNPNTRQIYFNDAQGYSIYGDFAKEDKIIYHEYSHSVIYDIQPGITSAYDDEEGAISEGTPDYFAGSFKYPRATIGNYASPYGVRDMDNPDIGSYSEYQDRRDNVTPIGEVESHDGGEFFSSILWDLRNSLGASKTDVLAYSALYGITGNPNFLEYRDAMINEAGEGYSQQDANTIQDAFAAKGVGDFVPLYVTISGPHFFPVPDQSGTWTTSVSGGTSPYSYQWLRRPTASPNQQWQQVGHNSTYSGSASGDTDFTLKVEVTDPNSRSGERMIDIKVGTIDPPPCTYCNNP